MEARSVGAAVRPVMVAVGGDSGAGKTTLTRGIYDIFGGENILNVCLDDYLTLDREGREREGVTALNPVANNLQLMEEHVLHLRAGQTIVKPVYDHATGTFAQPEVVRARPIVVVRGLFPLLTERLRNAFDVRVWLEPEDDLKYHWKLQRDVAHRGYLVEEVISMIVRRQEDLRQFIVPQIRHADIVVRFNAPAGYLKRRKEGATDEQLSVKLIHRSDDPIELGSALSDASNAGDVFSEYEGYYRDKKSKVFEISGEMDETLVKRLEDRLWYYMESHRYLRPEQIGTFLENGTSERCSHSLALSQLLLARRIVAILDRVADRRDFESVM